LDEKKAKIRAKVDIKLPLFRGAALRWLVVRVHERSPISCIYKKISDLKTFLCEAFAVRRGTGLAI
jgi:hypothetical protein